MKVCRAVNCLWALVLVLLIQGCASLGTYNPATGKKEFVAVSTVQEVEMGEQVHERLKKQYSFSDDTQQALRLDRVGTRVALVSDRQDYQYNFYLVEDDSLNAFTTPGGNIYVNTGLLNKLDNDDQLAFVIAHEIGHCAAKHVAKKYQTALGYDLIGNLILSQVSDTQSAQSVASLGTSVLMNLIFSAYSRNDEREADVLAVKYSYLAGFDPLEGTDVFYVLKQNSNDDVIPHMFKSHPDLLERIENVEKETARIKQQFKPFLTE